MDFDNLHQVLRNLYQEMMPLCGDMIGVAKGIAGLGALFYVAYRVWKALASAEPIDVFPLLRPFAIGLCRARTPYWRGRHWICRHTSNRRTIWKPRPAGARARLG